MIRGILGALKGTIFHPQWLSDRYHVLSKKSLRKLQNSLILDIGSGNSSYLSEIHPSNAFYTLGYPDTNEMYGVRPNVFGDARYLPVGNDALDVVLLFEVLEHVKDTEKVLNEIRRVLRPGGQLFISVPFIYPIHDAPNDYWRFTIFGIENTLEKHDFEVIESSVHGNTLIAGLQMINLGLLEMCRDIFRINGLFGVLSAVPVYPFTIVINFLAWPLINLGLGKAGNFGCFLMAKRKFVN